MPIGISTLSPASTYPDLLLINNSGQGLNNTVSQVQDGLGDPTLMTISDNFINFDRGIAQFQIDGIPLTANVATLNSVSDLANANYLLLSPNAQLSSASILNASNGISLTTLDNTTTISPTINSSLYGLQQFSLDDPQTGFLIYNVGNIFSTVFMQSDGTINITNPDGVPGNPTFSVNQDSCLQRVNTSLIGVHQSQRPELNFIPGANTGIVVFDNIGENRTDIYISSTPGGTGITPVQNGGTGASSFIPYSVITGGATATSPLQSVANVGTIGQVLTSSGEGALPIWANPGDLSLSLSVTQVSHGLVVGNIIRISNVGTYVKAKADSVANSTSVVGIVTAVMDVDTFTFQYGGIIDVLAGLSVGLPYFLDPTTLGGYTPTLPTTAGQTVLPLFYALSATTALWQPKSAIELT